jgi:predicted O-linked N-acetylglucosamine transferase (SPINDLY family)
VVEVTCYTNLPEAVADDMTRRYQAVSQGFRHTGGLADAEVARLVRADGIDILIDVSGHLTGARTGVFAAKPAPIQVTMMQVGSSGLAAMDYAVADAALLPEASPSFFTEHVIRLPVGFLFEPVADLTPPLSPYRAGRPPTFGSLNQLSKSGEPVLALWARVMARVPGSRLLLKAAGLASPAVRRRLLAFFAARGIASGRLDLRAWTGGYAAHLATFDEIDVVLDCFPYPGMTTSLEALLMGVPVVTLAGDRFVSRIGEAILKTVGHPEWIARDEDDYVVLAAALAGDAERLAGLKGRLRDDLLASPFGDPKSFTRGLEAAFRDAWRRWCSGQAA